MRKYWNKEYKKIIEQTQKKYIRDFESWLKYKMPSEKENNLAYICSPYRGNAYQRIRNIVYARRITRVALELGYMPIATHLYLPQILNDDIPAQRWRGLKAGKNILYTCGTIIIGARYGISEGMAAEIEEAAGKGAIIII